MKRAFILTVCIVPIFRSAEIALNQITTVDIILDMNDDLVFEGNESILITLANPVDSVLGTNTLHDLIIVDNEVMPVVAFASSASSKDEEAGAVTVLLVLDHASVVDITVPYTITGTSVSPDDHDLVVEVSLFQRNSQ